MGTFWRRSTSNSRAPRSALVLSLLALAVALVPVVQPLLGRDLTCGYDNTFHLWRAVQIDRLWEGGVLYSRWAPDMALGYGFPLYLFASPFPPALVAGMHRVGLGWSQALNGTFVLGIVFGGLAMFWLACELFRTRDRARGLRGVGPAAGLVAALAYVYAPFQAYDVFNRGSLWESFAWAFPPLVLLGVHRWSLDRDRRYLVVGTGAFAAMVLSHHLFAFLFAPVFALWVVAHAFQKRSWAVLGRGTLLGVLGLGLTAFFWLPPMLERSYVQTGRLLGTWVFDYRYNFLSLGHLLALPRRADPALSNDWPVKALGAIPAFVAFLPLLGWQRLSRQRRWQVAVLWVLAAGTAFLTLPESLWIWDRVPLLSYVQFPWRYLGPAAFCLALLAGAAIAVLAEACRGGDAVGQQGRWVGWGTAGLAAIMILANLGWFYPRTCSAPGDPTVADMIRWERMTDTLGTTAKGEYLPVWVQRFPEESLDDQYATGEPIARLRQEDLPDGARIVAAEYGVQSATIDIETPIAFQANYLAFYYPGWRVTIDGASVPVSPSAAMGLLSFDVPAGRHDVRISFGETSVRLGADAISVMSLAALAILAVVFSPRSRPDRVADSTQPVPVAAAAALAVVTLLVAGKLLVVDRLGLLWRGSLLEPDGTFMGASSPMDVRFGEAVVLLGTSRLPAMLGPDESPVLTLYWRALNPGGVDWHVGLTLIGPDGSRWAAGLRPARWARTPPRPGNWPPGTYARMDYHLDVPPGLAPGVFGLELALFDRATASPASVLGADGNPAGPGLLLGQVEILAPEVVPSLAALGADPTATLETCGAIGLWDVDLSRLSAAPGDLVGLRTTWEAVADPEQDQLMNVTLEDGTGQQIRTWDLPLAASWWPTGRWATGDRWVGRSELRLPGSLESGEYALLLGLGDCGVAAWSIRVQAPDRTWRVPADLEPADVVLGGVARLAGYEVGQTAVSPGGTVDVTLAWQAQAEILVSYRVYLHVVDRAGNMLAQSDGEPVGWTRPTTGWAVGEVVVDPRTLTIPGSAEPGMYEVRVGLYGPDGVRLTTRSGEDGVVLGVIEVR